MSPRLDRMSLREIEDAGQRWYERLGRLNGEDCDTAEYDEDFDPDDETLQRKAAGYVIDHLDSEDEVLVVLAMLFAPVRS